MKARLAPPRNVTADEMREERREVLESALTAAVADSRALPAHRKFLCALFDLPPEDLDPPAWHRYLDEMTRIEGGTNAWPARMYVRDQPLLFYRALAAEIWEHVRDLEYEHGFAASNRTARAPALAAQLRDVHDGIASGRIETLWRTVFEPAPSDPGPVLDPMEDA